MKTYYYVHTGHRIGLDRFRRSVAILNALDEDITLLCSDFRIAHIVRDFGLKNAVGLDLVRNIPHIANRGDKLFFDSDEANPLMLEDMRDFFSTFIRVSDDEKDTKNDNEYLISPYLAGEEILKITPVQDKYFHSLEKTTKISLFFGDDDYEKDLEKHLSFVEGLDISLQLGFYYFLDYEETLKEKFPKHFEFEEYDRMIQSSAILITASPQAILDSLASGAKPIYFQREDYPCHFQALFKSLNIPIVENYDANHLKVIIKTINNINYKKLSNNMDNLKTFLKECL